MEKEIRRRVRMEMRINLYPELFVSGTLAIHYAHCVICDSHEYEFGPVT